MKTCGTVRTAQVGDEHGDEESHRQKRVDHPRVRRTQADVSV
jgi:hypothetical protein